MECMLCPRHCHIDREQALGFCGLDHHAKIAKVMLHRWEEPCLTQENGSGAIFFSGCQLKCIFCQNHDISKKAVGRNVTSDELYEIFHTLKEQGASNINLVSPTPHLSVIIPAIEKAKKEGFSLPFVYNTSGYETVETISHLAGLIDIFLPDAKFASNELSKELASAYHYPEISLMAIRAMYRLTGPLQWENKRLTRGVIVRHLVLPSLYRDSLQVLENLAENLPADGFILSVMRQYTPTSYVSQHPFLNRKVTTLEYEKVVEKAKEIGFQWVYAQGKDSADSKYVPDFNCND